MSAPFLRSIFLLVALFATTGCESTGGTKEQPLPPLPPSAYEHALATFSVNCKKGLNGGVIPGASHTHT